MENLTDISVIKKICQKYGFKFKKGLGQNFLCDYQVVCDIINGTGITKETNVIEIGPGFGSLTESLLKSAKSVTSVEIDETLIPVLNDIFKDYDNFTLINKDVLKFNLNEIIKDDNTVLVANLPYYITTPIITYLLEEKFNLKSITVMVQKEVADRLVAKPGTKNYGAITCLIDYYTNAEIITEVPADSFVPPPNVDSAVVKMEVLKEPRVKPKNERMFFNLIKASFNQRRKTFINGISNSGITKLSKADFQELILSLGYDVNLRGETLSISDFCKIADSME